MGEEKERRENYYRHPRLVTGTVRTYRRLTGIVLGSQEEVPFVQRVYLSIIYI